MVELRILQQTHGANCWKWVFADDRFDVIVEVDNIGFPEA